MHQGGGHGGHWEMGGTGTGLCDYRWLREETLRIMALASGVNLIPDGSGLVIKLAPFFVGTSWMQGGGVLYMPD